MDRSLNCTVRVHLTSQGTPMQGPPRVRHVYVVGLLHGWGFDNLTLSILVEAAHYAFYFKDIEIRVFNKKSFLLCLLSFEPDIRLIQKTYRFNYRLFDLRERFPL